MENIYSGKNAGFNKSVFIIALGIALLINLFLLSTFEYYLSNTKDISPIKEPKIVYRPLEPQPLPEPVKKKEKRKRPKEIKKFVKKRKKQKTQKKNIEKNKGVEKKATGSKTEKEPVIPAVTPPLPESVNLDDKTISLPQDEIPQGNFVDVPSEKVVIKEFKAVSPGKFSPSFGTKLSKLDTGAKGTAKDRKVVYRPPPPTVRAKVLPPPVKVKIWINPDGTVEKVQLLETTGNPEIDKKIREYMLSWKFSRINSNKKQWAITTIRFKNK